MDYQRRPDAAVAGDARHHYRRSNRCSVGAHQERGVPEGARDRDVGVHGGRDEAEAVGFFQAEDRAKRGVPAGNALDGSEDGLAMAHRRSQLTAEVDVDDSIIADGFFGNNCQEPESDEEE
ncbi:unnamed protein product [Closterium sp. NIES-54]